MPSDAEVRYRVPDNLTDEDITEARRALEDLARILGRASAEASHRLGINFDMNDPQVAREVMMATFEALVLSKPPKRRKPAEGRRG